MLLLQLLVLLLQLVDIPDQLRGVVGVGSSIHTTRGAICFPILGEGGRVAQELLWTKKCPDQGIRFKIPEAAKPQNTKAQYGQKSDFQMSGSPDIGSSGRPNFRFGRSLAELSDKH